MLNSTPTDLVNVLVVDGHFSIVARDLHGNILVSTSFGPIPLITHSSFHHHYPIAFLASWSLALFHSGHPGGNLAPFPSSSNPPFINAFGYSQ